MKLNQEFEVARSLDDVWDFFKDIPTVAGCLPGAEYDGLSDDGKHNGKMSMKVGPFQTSFVGVADVTYDDETHGINLKGSGVDKKGSSRGKMSMVCKLEANGASTKASVDADVHLSGSLAQIGRTGIIEEIANVLVTDFVKNVEAALAVPEFGDVKEEDARPSPMPSSGSVSGFGLLMRALKAWFGSIFKKR